MLVSGKAERQIADRCGHCGTDERRKDDELEDIVCAIERISSFGKPA